MYKDSKNLFEFTKDTFQLKLEIFKTETFFENGYLEEIENIL